MNIITGYRGEPHITSQQDRNSFRGIIGSGSYITVVGTQMYASATSATNVRVQDGVLVMQGCFAEIPEGSVENLTIDSGTQNRKRIDLIVARYTKDPVTEVEDMQLAVIKGTPAASNPSTPSYTDGDIGAGDLLAEFPLYKVNIDGLTIDSVERLAKILTTTRTIDETIGTTALPTGYTTITQTLAMLNRRVSSYSGLAPTPTEAGGGADELYIRYNNQVISAYNTPTTSYLVFIQARTAGNAATEIYGISINDTSGGSADTKIYHIAGTNAIHTLFVGSAQGSCFIRTTGKTVGYYCDVTVIKTRGTSGSF